MTLLEGDLAGVFSAAFSGLYVEATLYRPSAFADDGKGGGTSSGFGPGEPVKAQLDSATQAMRASEGFVETDQRILVLAHGVAPIDTDCEISVKGQRWAIASVTQDPAGAYYDLHGRRAAVSA